MKILSLFLFLNSSLALADSGCWPEETLIQKTSVGYIEGINVLLKGVEAKSTDKCEVKIYSTPEDKDPKVIACDQLQCEKGVCGGEGDYTILPIEDSKKPFVQVKLKEDKKAWLKFVGQHTIVSVLPIGKEGTLFPITTPMLDAPNGKTLILTSTYKLAYKLKKITKIKKEEWAEVDVSPILNEEPPVKLGKPLGVGYFKSRSSDNKVIAVLSDIWCD